MRALISVWDKRGVVDFARGLSELGFEILSTGGTRRVLSESGIPVVSVEEETGFPEILNGRVKSLHPRLYGGILALRDRDEHMREIEELGIKPIDLVAVNLYPFPEVIKRDVSLHEALENIDIGGPSLIRASAKNYPHVIVVVDPEDYGWVLERLKKGGLSLEERRELAKKAFLHTALYDSIISGWLGAKPFLESFPIVLDRGLRLRYGENPHQTASFYGEGFEKIKGKEISYNNILDADSAFSLVLEYDEPTIAIIKHTNPCGLSSHKELAEAMRRAFSGDPLSAYGGIIASNRKIDRETALEIKKSFFELVIAPDYEDDALEVLEERKDLIVLKAKAMRREYELRKVIWGYLIQSADEGWDERWEVVTRRKPTEKELEDLRFGMRAVKHIKSNAIAIVKDKTLVGMGAGQPSRVYSTEIAIKRAGERARGAVLSSDAFFPFPDSVELAGKAGITAIAQPGGSLRDKDSIIMADRFDMAMIFTGRRHFKH